jgi:hypothetical protein
MSIKKQTVRVCDVCGRVTVAEDNAQQIGGNVFGGWFSVQETGGSTLLTELKKKRQFDCCSYGCLVKLANNLTQFQ